MPVIETLTALRIAAGLVGVGTTLLYGKDDTGGSLYDKIPEAIFGQAIGGIFFEYFKEGSAKAHEKFVKEYGKYININRNSLNHDLQKAARKAQLVATFFAAQDCLEKIKAENLPDAERGILGKTYDKGKDFIKGKDSREVYLEAIIKYLNDSINSLETADFVENLTFNEFTAVFDTYKQASNPDNQKKIADEFKTDIIRELEFLEIADSDIKRDAEALKNLKKAIRNGWNAMPKGNALNQNYVSLSIIELPQSALGKRHDWFDLVCVVFNEEYKENPRVETAAQKQMLLDISKKLDSFGTVNSEDYKKLIEQINTFADDIKDVKAAVKRIEEKVDENIEISKKIREMVSEIISPFADNVSPDFVNLPDMRTDIFGRGKGN